MISGYELNTPRPLTQSDFVSLTLATLQRDARSARILAPVFRLSM